ncbi:MAG: YdcF family protein [Bacteroidetes bacterium]|nr:YdcF family protein [Bacteroidota bacterium]
MSKLFVILLRPICWAVALGIWALLTKNTRRRKRILIILTVMLFLVSNKVLVNEMARAWETEPPQTHAAFPAMAIVLGGYAEEDTDRNRVQMSEAADRLYSAVILYRLGSIQKILLSGGSVSLTGKVKPESDIVKPYLIQLGVDSTDILVENRSRNTMENAEYSASLPGVEKNKPVLLITSAFHMRRAFATFKKAGFKPVPWPVHFISDKGRHYTFADWILPSSEALFRFDAISKEWVGYLVYAATGKL